MASQLTFTQTLQVVRLRGKGVYTVSCSDGCSAAITAEGGLYTWGDGSGGQLGHGHHFGVPEPKQVPHFAEAGIKVAQVRALMYVGIGEQATW